MARSLKGPEAPLTDVQMQAATLIAQGRPAADVAQAVASLGEGDTEGAAEAYQRVTSRWGALRALSLIHI